MQDHTQQSGRSGPVAIALSEFFDGYPVATFAIDSNCVITHWNNACQRLSGRDASQMIGTSNHSLAFFGSHGPMLADRIVRGDTVGLAQFTPSAMINGAYENEAFFPNLGENGLWLHGTAAPLRDATGKVVGAIESINDVTARRVAENALRQAHSDLESLVHRRTGQLADVNDQLARDILSRQSAEDELRRRNIELTELNAKLSMAQEKLVQSDKLASIGQLAAGVAHEINNPIGYIFSNFGTLQNYLDQLFVMLDLYQEAESQAPAAVAARLRDMREKIDLDFLREDIPGLMSESREGIARVRSIVQDLKDFSRVDANQEWVWASIHGGIDSTLNIVSNEVKYKADVVREFGDIPDIECLPSQLNQVVMNLVVNAAHAVGDKRGLITIRTGHEGEHVWIEVQDNGCGIERENLKRIFDPFFTTKPVGKGTGLGLSLSYGIVQKHRGRIDVDSEPGVGTTFRITLPVRHTEDEQ
ncbi:MAG TPA: ATP-binding protein [Telluria sp.]|nr:ATP-binding protein [Telluria sp.]